MATYECSYCGNEFNRKPSQVKRSSKIYCSLKCVGLDRQTSDDYRKHQRRQTRRYLDFREECLEAVGYQCSCCAEDDIICLDLHHREPIETHPELSFETTNIKVLCANCHRKIHRGE